MNTVFIYSAIVYIFSLSLFNPFLSIVLRVCSFLRNSSQSEAARIFCRWPNISNCKPFSLIFRRFIKATTINVVYARNTESSYGGDRQREIPAPVCHLAFIHYSRALNDTRAFNWALKSTKHTHTHNQTVMMCLRKENAGNKYTRNKSDEKCMRSFLFVCALVIEIIKSKAEKSSNEIKNWDSKYSMPR